MKKEFVTLHGKAYIERDIIFFKSPYLPFEETVFAQIGIEILWMLVFASQFLKEDGPRRNIGIIVFAFLLLSRIPNIYDKFLKRSYSNRIPLSRIADISTESDHLGIQTKLKIILKNGRYKKVTFRNLENQLEEFVAVISPTTLKPGIA